MKARRPLFGTLALAAALAVFGAASLLPCACLAAPVVGHVDTAEATPSHCAAPAPTGPRLLAGGCGCACMTASVTAPAGWLAAKALVADAAPAQDAAFALSALPSHPPAAPRPTRSPPPPPRVLRI